MRMTYTSVMQFYENVDMSMLWSISRHGGMKRVPRRRNRNGATATYPKMMPWQHIGSGSSQRYRCKRRRDVSESCKMVGWSRLPGSHGTVARQKRGIARTIRSRCKTRASHSTHAIGPRRSSRGYTFEACIRGGMRFVEGSRRSRDEVEVVVHGSSSEVDVLATEVVHVGGSRTWRSWRR